MSKGKYAVLKIAYYDEEDVCWLKYFIVLRDWLETKLKEGDYPPVDEFLDEYTSEESNDLYGIAVLENQVIKEFGSPFDWVKYLVLQGLDSGYVTIQTEGYCCSGIHCVINGDEFYFLGSEAEEIETVDEYWKRFDKNMTADMLADVLLNEEEHGLGEDEGASLIAYLKGVVGYGK